MISKRTSSVWVLILMGALLLSACNLPTRPSTSATPSATTIPEETTLPEVETPTPPENQSPIAFLNAAGARDVALSFIRSRHGPQGPETGLSWSEENITPQNLVGSSMLRYRSGDWSLEVQYPVVSPEDLVYTFEVLNTISGFRWAGTVKAIDGQVSELSVVVPALVTVTPSASPTQLASTTPTAQACSDAVEFVMDITVPDGTTFQTGEPFVKTWRLRNKGNCVWTSEYLLVPTGGETLSTSIQVSLPSQVNPGNVIDLSVNMIAPATPGKYRSEWMLRNPNGAYIGLGEKSDRAFWVEIEVIQPTGALNLGAPDWQDSLNDSRFWYLVKTENTEFEIEDSRLMMKSKEPGQGEEWGLTNKGDLEDFYLEATFITGDQCSGLDRYGVLVRAPTANSGYVYGFSCDGRYRIYKWDGENYTALQEWTRSGFILSGSNQTNQLGILIDGKTLKLYANGKLLAELEDNEYDEGRFGLFIGAGESNDFTVFVDEIAYWILD